MKRDVDAVEAALSRWARTDRRYRRLTRAVLAAQGVLRRATTRKVWDLFLAVEEQANALHYELVSVAIQLALRRGRRARTKVNGKAE